MTDASSQSGIPNAALVARAKTLAGDIEEMEYASPVLHDAFVGLCFDGVAPDLVTFDPDLWLVRYGSFGEPDMVGRLMAAYLRLWLRHQALASAIEAAAAGETANAGSTEGESAVAKGDAHV